MAQAVADEIEAEIAKLGLSETKDRKSIFLLISGTTVIPKNLKNLVCPKNEKTDTMKTSFSKDITKMKKRIESCKDFELFKVLRNYEKLRKKTVLKNVTELIEKSYIYGKSAVIYYTGYGIWKSGDWVFADGQITPEEFVNAIPQPPKV